MSPHPVRIGLFGIGLDAYWQQFSGLKERLQGYLGEVEGKLGRPGVEVVNLGLIRKDSLPPMPPAPGSRVSGGGVATPPSQ